MKVRELQQRMRKKGVDSCVLFSNTPNFFYFAQQDFSGAVVVPKNGAMTFVASQLDAPRGKVKVWSKGKLHDTLGRVVRGTVGVDKDMMTVKQYAAFRKAFHQPGIDLSGFINDLRRTKTALEIRMLGRACKTTEEIMNDCITRFRKFNTERDAANFLRKLAIEHDCELAFEPIVATAGYASIPHHRPRRVKLRKGFCIIDFGVKHRGYCADLTRTIYIGRPGRRVRDIFNTTQLVQQDVINMVAPGVKTDALYRAAKEGLGKNLIHGLGHGVGIEIHEAPKLTSEDSQELAAGNVITIEPGSYQPRGFGIRLEDMVLVTKKGCRLLSKQQEFITV
jgi:Xaa-Pro aminopeptidase